MLLMVSLMPCEFAIAQLATPERTRAEVNAETLAAAKAHQLTPAGEGAAPVAVPATRSGRTTSQVRAETLLAAKNGTLTPAGEGGDWQVDRRVPTSVSTLSRAAVVRATLAAAKAHEFTPAGEGP